MFEHEYEDGIRDEGLHRILYNGKPISYWAGYHVIALGWLYDENHRFVANYIAVTDYLKTHEIESDKIYKIEEV